jgi:hypothetical protein
MTPDAALRYQQATEDRDRVVAEALAQLATPAAVVNIAAAKTLIGSGTPHFSPPTARRRPHD